MASVGALVRAGARSSDARRSEGKGDVQQRGGLLRRRVEAAGRRVIDWNESRVLGVLATLRSMGDYCLKQYVMAEPEDTVSKRTELDDFLVIASDGLWDALSNEAACQVMRRCLDRYIKRRFPEELRGSNVVKVATVLAKLAMARDSQDNINVIMVELKKPN
ncbi:protein phosphatase 2C 51-like [Eucalyptus grandis]|uniref:protein phosphatase 2C 51-like n=1 Tax=Eucalyptus grandis TaxID=71139 RepID=UPI00192F04FB|nr:protein phosphatase 2C 51-like [Eucalyptus grandis]